MGEGYISDASDETVMDEPQVTVSIDLTDLPPEQALSIAQEAGLQQESWVIGELAKGEKPDGFDMADAEFHLTLGEGLTALASVGAVDIEQEPPADTTEAINNE